MERCPGDTFPAEIMNQTPCQTHVRRRCYSTAQVKVLSGFLAGRIDLNLDQAALHLAAIEHPGIDIDSNLAVLDALAADLSARTGNSAGADYVSAANGYLFGELGFRGNARDYYNPSNSCLNEVLTSRTGLPITLSVVYMEIARRLGKPVYGVGLPGHFVAEYNDGAYATYIDAFHGQVLDAVDCLELARKVAGDDAVRSAEALSRSSNRQIVARMMNNLRGVYFSRRAHRKLRTLLTVMIDANPMSAPEYQQRAMVSVQLNDHASARADLERFLELYPLAEDREEIEKRILALKRLVAGFN